MPSGLWHHVQRNGQPFKKIVVRIPGPSWIANSSMLNIIPFFITCGILLPFTEYYVKIREDSFFGLKSNLKKITLFRYFVFGVFTR